MPQELSLYAKGALLGLSVSAPLGPIGVLCIRETLARGFRAGVAVGLGAAAADLVYAVVAAFGLFAVAEALAPAAGVLRLLAGAVLAWLAVRAFRAPAAPARAQGPVPGARAGSFMTSFVLLITNPAAIIIFSGVFVGLGLRPGASPGAASAVVAGVVSGAVGWWAALAGGVTVFRARLTPRVLRGVNIASGIVLAAFAAVTWWGAG